MNSASAPMAIGFRVEPKRFHWAVVSATRDAPHLEDAGTYEPPAVEEDQEAEALSSCRRETKDLFERFKPARAWVRAAERARMVDQLSLMRRCRAEGVIMATLDALGVEVSIGRLGSITASVKPKVTKGEKGRSVKGYLEAERFRTIDWEGHSPNVREAILAAVSALPR